MTDPTNDPVADASRGDDADPNAEQVPPGGRGAGTVTPGSSTEAGLSTVPLSAEDLDPDDDLVAGAPIDDDPGGDTSVG